MSYRITRMRRMRRTENLRRMVREAGPRVGHTQVAPG